MRNSTLRIISSLMLAMIAFMPGVACNRSTSDRDIVYKRPSELVELSNTAGGAFGSKGLPKVLWLDPRTASEFAAGHVPQATNIPFPDIEPTHEVTCRGFDVYVVYDTDYDDVMAKAAAKRLVELGYKPVYAMLGGLKAWEVEGLPVKREPKTE
jgi:rhodanese-related sulfurtransferase